MSTASLKQNAKNLLSKNYGYCLAISLLMTLGGFAGGGVSYSTNFNFETNSPSPDTSVFPQFGTMIEDLITNPFVIIGAFIGVVAASIFSLAFAAFVTNQFKVGGYRFFLRNRKNYPSDFKAVFASYKDKTFLNIAKVTIIRDIIVGLGYCLFFIPGLLWQLQYFAVDFILAVRPDINRTEAFSLSKRLMNGHKADLFCLYLSFFGWALLTVFTCGIVGIFYVNPYMELTYTEFFCAIREDAINKGVITHYDIPDYPEYISPAPVYSQPNYNNAAQPICNNTSPNQPVNYSAPVVTEDTPIEMAETGFVTPEVIEVDVTEPEAPQEPTLPEE